MEATQNPDSEAARVRKAKRSALFMAATSIALLAVAGANGWMAHRHEREVRLLETVALPGEAQVLRLFVAPNGVTPRLEYRITTPDGRTATRNVEVVPAYWEDLAEEKTVPVLYVPDEPKISRLVSGEVEEQGLADSPTARYVLSAVLAAIGLFLLAAAGRQWRGWDVDLDSKTHKLSFKRFGTGS